MLCSGVASINASLTISQPPCVASRAVAHVVNALGRYVQWSRQTRLSSYRSVQLLLDKEALFTLLHGRLSMQVWAGVC